MSTFYKVFEVMCMLGKSVFEFLQLTIDCLLNYYYLFATVIQIGVLLFFHTGGKIIATFQAASLLLASWFYSPLYYVKDIYNALTSILSSPESWVILGFLLGLASLIRSYINFLKARVEYDKQQTRRYLRSLKNRRRNQRRRLTR